MAWDLRCSGFEFTVPGSQFLAKVRDHSSNRDVTALSSPKLKKSGFGA